MATKAKTVKKSTKKTTAKKSSPVKKITKNKTPAKKITKKKDAKTPAKKAIKKSTKKTAKKVSKKKSSSDKKTVEFSISAAKGHNVSVAGTFNNWNEKSNMLKYAKNIYSTKIKLSKGRYEYKFIIDGEWIADPKAGEQIHNNVGSVNSVVVVD